ncbi:type II secretion system protein [Candidatus Sumerlaeota bacterium]|nr:type II secretion system protein [Candidatus Sumerlaeota bacterium]
MPRTNNIMIRKRRARSSFILLEVMVSLLILSIGFTAVMQSFSMALKALRRQEIITTSVMLANSFIEDLEHNPALAREGTGSWEAYPNYEYEIMIEEEEPRYDVKSDQLNDFHTNLTWVSIRVEYYDPNRPQRRPYIGAELATCLINFERFARDTRMEKLRQEGGWEKYK